MKKMLLFIMTIVLIPYFVQAKVVDTDTIMKKISPDLENATFKMKKPADDIEADFNVSGYVSNLIGGDDYTVVAGCQEPYNVCTVSFYSDDYDAEWDDIEGKEVVTNGWKTDYEINVTWDAPTANSTISKYISELRDSDMGDPSTYYMVEDLSLINYYLTGSKSELWNHGAAGRALKFSTLNNTTKGANVTYYIDIRAGDQGEGLMYESAHGPMSIFYNGYLYGAKGEGVYLKRVIYIPEDTADTTEAYVTAAQERINNYLGNDSVIVSYGGTLASLNDARKEEEANARIANGEVEGVDFTRDELFGAEDTEYPITSDGNYYLIKIDNRTYNFYIVKGSADKLVAPTYNGIEINSKIEISSDDSSIPLDASLTVNNVNDNTIKNKVGTENFKAYDISIRSDAKEADIKELENGKFLVRIPIPDELKEKETLIIYYLPSDGVREEYTVTPKTIDGTVYAEFETSHFSVYVLAEKIEEESEPTFNVTYDFNGGTADGKGKKENEQVSYALNISKENFIDAMGVTPPEGMELDAIEINGTRTELGDGYMLNKDTVFKYLWKAIANDEEEEEETTTSNTKPETISTTEKEEEPKTNNPQTGDNIMMYISILILSIVGLIVTLVISKKRYN